MKSFPAYLKVSSPSRSSDRGLSESASSHGSDGMMDREITSFLSIPLSSDKEISSKFLLLPNLISLPPSLPIIMSSYPDEKASLGEKEYESNPIGMAVAPEVKDLMEGEETITEEEEKKVLRKIDMALMPLMMFSVMREYISRMLNLNSHADSNLSFTSPRASASLKIGLSCSSIP